MPNKKIGLKFCGHCSPRKDMQNLSERLREAAECFTFVYYSEDSHVDALLILNACEAACAQRPGFDGPVVDITPETVNHWPVAADRMVTTILSILEYGEGR